MNLNSNKAFFTSSSGTHRRLLGGRINAIARILFFFESNFQSEWLFNEILGDHCKSKYVDLVLLENIHQTQSYLSITGRMFHVFEERDPSVFSSTQYPMGPKLSVDQNQQGCILNSTITGVWHH